MITNAGKARPRRTKIAGHGDAAGFGFARHETFHLRYGWLRKGYDAVRQDPHAFVADDAPERLGVGQNMVTSIRYWLLATGIAEPVPGFGRVPGYRVTPFAEILFDGDPYLEDTNSIWLIHARLTSNPSQATTWYWAFNLFGDSTFNQDSFLRGIRSFLLKGDAPEVADGSLQSDFSCLIRTYVDAGTTLKRTLLEDTLDSPLAEIALIDRTEGETGYRFRTGPKPGIAPEVFGYALFKFWEASGRTGGALALDDLRWAPLSPGRLFQLDADGLLTQVEALERSPLGRWIRYDHAAGLRQVYVKPTEPNRFLEAYYGR